MTKLEHANVTMVPFQMGEPARRVQLVNDATGVALSSERSPDADHAHRCRPLAQPGPDTGHDPLGAGPAVGRRRVLECVVVDETGGILLVFLGRRKIPGIELGAGSRPKAWSASRAATSRI